MSKKALSVRSVIALPIISLALAACGGNNSDSSTEGAEAPVPKVDLTTPEAQARMAEVDESIERMISDGSLPELDRTETLSGQDSNVDGIRDDLQNYLNNQPLTTEEREGMREVARQIQRIQTAETMTETLAREISDDLVTASICTSMSATSPDAVDDLEEELFNFTANTEERYARWSEYNSLLAGSVITLPTDEECAALTAPSTSQASTKLLSEPRAQATNNTPGQCGAQRRLGLGFFNGVGNTKTDAAKSLLATKYELDVLVTEEDSLDIRGFYNPTELFGLEDVFETFRQRSAEVELVPESEALLNRYPEIVAAAVRGDRYVVSKFTAEYGGERQEELERLFFAIGQKRYVDAFDDTQVPTDIYQMHAKILDRWVDEERRMIMVAHSQGNLFVNQAYDYLIETQGVAQSNVSVLHVAPASLRLVGSYVLADADLIINALPGSPASNVDIPLLPSADRSGHGYIPIYLSEFLASGQYTRNLLAGAYTALDFAETAGSPFFKATFEYDDGLFTPALEVTEVLDEYVLRGVTTPSNPIPEFGRWEETETGAVFYGNCEVTNYFDPTRSSDDQRYVYEYQFLAKVAADQWPAAQSEVSLTLVAQDGVFITDFTDIVEQGFWSSGQLLSGQLTGLSVIYSELFPDYESGALVWALTGATNNASGIVPYSLE